MSQPRLAHSSNKFILTGHAITKMRERNIYHPYRADRLRIPEQKAKKSIINSCVNKGYDNYGYVYWIESMYKNPRAVYVCKAKGVGEYIVLTVFWLK